MTHAFSSLDELGEGPGSDGDDLADKIAKLSLPEDVRAQVDKERADAMLQKYNFCLSSTNGSTN